MHRRPKRDQNRKPKPRPCLSAADREERIAVSQLMLIDLLEMAERQGEDWYPLRPGNPAYDMLSGWKGSSVILDLEARGLIERGEKSEQEKAAGDHTIWLRLSAERDKAIPIRWKRNNPYEVPPKLPGIYWDRWPLPAERSVGAFA